MRLVCRDCRAIRNARRGREYELPGGRDMSERRLVWKSTQNTNLGIDGCVGIVSSYTEICGSRRTNLALPSDE